LNVGFERGSIVSAAAHKAAPPDDNVVDMIVELARRNEALEDFAALVAHELRRRCWLRWRPTSRRGRSRTHSSSSMRSSRARATLRP